MGVQRKAFTSDNSMQRVKVYRLNNAGKWDDQGTGHVTVDCLERSDNLGLIVIDEEDNDTLLVHHISSDDIYRRQEDTIISWRDQELSTELALSFQEATVCSYIWDHICEVQRNLHFSSLSTSEALEATGTLQSNDESFHGVNSELRQLPTIELSTLPLILKTVLECGISDQMHVAELILQDKEFFPKLMDLFRMSEDLENMDGLHILFKLVKGIILLNNPQILDKIFGDEFILDIVGSLEYNPEVSQVQRHRTFLKDHVVFKEPIPIKDSSVLSRIHQTYRIGYVKDVILAGVLDEATSASLNSIIHANNAVVVSLLKDDVSFIHGLFARMRSSSTSAESKRNLVLFLQEFCILSKSLQHRHQLRLLQDLATEGIFDIITDVLQSQDRRIVSIGTDILILFLNQDPNLLRSYVCQQEGNSLGLLVKGMVTDFGEDINCPFLEIIRILLDPKASSGSQEDKIIEIFYEKYLGQLIDVIASSCPPESTSQMIGKSPGFCGGAESHPSTKAEILSNICELLCFCVLHHPYKIKCYFLLNNVIEKVLYLTRRREKFLVVAAVRFMRTIISLNDEHLLRHIANNNHLGPIIESFVKNGDRYNMLHSGVLELFEYIRKENLKTLILDIVNHFWDQLLKFERLEAIQALKIKYDQSLENCDKKNSADIPDPRKRINERGLVKEDKEYFNEDSDEEDSASARLSHTRNLPQQPLLPNGTSVSNSPLRTGSGGLVDYEEDDDDDDDEYNPPSSKPKSSTEDDRSADFCKSKRKTAPKADKKDKDLEQTKKHKLEYQHPNDDKVPVAAASSTCCCNDSPGKGIPLPAIAPCTTDTNGDLDEPDIVKENSPPQICNSCLPDSAHTRQSTGEDCASTPNGNGAPVNGTNVTGSEPYSVR